MVHLLMFLSFLFILRRQLQHLISYFVEGYEYQLSLLTNADEAISSWSRCLPLCYDSMLCPLSHVYNSSVGSHLTINPSFLHWKKHDQLILSALLSSLSIDILYLVVDCQTSHCVLRTLEQTLISTSNSHIIQL